MFARRRRRFVNSIVGLVRCFHWLLSGRCSSPAEFQSGFVGAKQHWRAHGQVPPADGVWRMLAEGAARSGRAFAGGVDSFVATRLGRS